jgi:hypothetical protein
MNWKRVKVENYQSFEMEMFDYRYESPEDLLNISNGMLTIWDDRFGDQFFEKSSFVQRRLLDFRSDIIKEYLKDYHELEKSK